MVESLLYVRIGSQWQSWVQGTTGHSQTQSLLPCAPASLAEVNKGTAREVEAYTHRRRAGGRAEKLQ